MDKKELSELIHKQNIALVIAINALKQIRSQTLDGRPPYRQLSQRELVKIAFKALEEIKNINGIDETIKNKVKL